MKWIFDLKEMREEISIKLICIFFKKNEIEKKEI